MKGKPTHQFCKIFHGGALPRPLSPSTLSREPVILLE